MSGPDAGAADRRVHLEGAEPSGLAEMLAGLVEANAAADPVRSRLLDTTRGLVQIDVPDAAVTVGLKFVPGALTVTSGAVDGADLRVRADADTLMSLSMVPLRVGLPDPLTAPGREVARKLLTGRLKVRGRSSGLRMLRTVNRLLSTT
jgi:hypothetical protein